MKIMLCRCFICDSWFKPSAHNGHCPNCAAIKLAGKHYNSATGREITSAFRNYNRLVERLVTRVQKGN